MTKLIGFRAIGIASLASGVLAVCALPALAQEGGRPLNTSLSGAAEKPAPGDPDGSGSAALRVIVGQNQI